MMFIGYQHGYPVHVVTDICDPKIFWDEEQQSIGMTMGQMREQAAAERAAAERVLTDA